MDSTQVLQIIIAFLFGIIITMLLLHAFEKTKIIRKNSTRITTRWQLMDIKGTSPLLIVAEKIEGETPHDCLIVLKTKDGIKLNPKSNTQIRINKNANSNFAVGDLSALIFTSYIREGNFAVWTADRDIILRLRAEFNKLWESSENYRHPKP